MNEKIRLQKILKEHIISFISDIGEVVPEFDSFLARCYFESIEDEELMKHAIQYILPHYNPILEKDIEFFKKEKYNIFKFDKKEIDKFEKKLILPENQGGMVDEDKEVVWKYLQEIVKTVAKHEKISKSD